MVILGHDKKSDLGEEILQGLFLSEERSNLDITRLSAPEIMILSSQFPQWKISSFIMLGRITKNIADFTLPAIYAILIYVPDIKLIAA